MGRVVVVGSGDFGRDVVTWLRHDKDYLGADAIAMLDDDDSALALHPQLHSNYAGKITDYVPARGDKLLMGIASPSTKRKLSRWAQQRSIEFSTFIHHSAIVAADAQIGQGSIICPNAVVSTSTVLGRLVTVNLATTVDHDATVGDYTSLMNQVDITGWAQIGERVFVGSHATVLPQVRVGDEAVIGAGSVVRNDVPPSTTVAGVPARTLRVKN